MHLTLVLYSFRSFSYLANKTLICEHLDFHLLSYGLLISSLNFLLLHTENRIFNFYFIFFKQGLNITAKTPVIQDNSFGTNFWCGQWSETEQKLLLTCLLSNKFLPVRVLFLMNWVRKMNYRACFASPLRSSKMQPSLIIVSNYSQLCICRQVPRKQDNISTALCHLTSLMHRNVDLIFISSVYLQFRAHSPFSFTKQKFCTPGEKLIYLIKIQFHFIMALFTSLHPAPCYQLVASLFFALDSHWYLLTFKVFTASMSLDPTSLGIAAVKPIFTSSAEVISFHFTQSFASPLMLACLIREAFLTI